MPVLESTDKITPRSILRHRPIADNATLKEQNPLVARPMTPIVKRASRLRQPNTSEDVTEKKHAEDGEDLGDGTAKAAGQAAPTSKLPPKASLAKTKRQPFHPLLYLGMGMLATIALLAVVIALSNWVGTTLDDLRYGYPRTFQIDAYVGHNESAGTPSHFIALN